MFSPHGTENKIPYRVEIVRYYFRLHGTKSRYLTICGTVLHASNAQRASHKLVVKKESVQRPQALMAKRPNE